MKVMTISDKPFRLLDLPPEIWSRIVKLAVTFDNPIKFNPQSKLAVTFDKPIKFNPQSGGLQRSWITRYYVEPPLTRTCRTIRAESLQEFYHVNTFGFFVPCPEDTHLKRWLNRIGPANRMAMGSIRIHFEPFADNFSIDTILQAVSDYMCGLEGFGVMEDDVVYVLGGNVLRFTEAGDCGSRNGRPWCAQFAINR